MTRKHACFLSETVRICLAFSVLLSGLFVTTANGEETSGKRPNLLFIVVDDQSPFDLSVYNPNSKLETPNIDRLASEGMVFDGAYHMGAWAGPS